MIQVTIFLDDREKCIGFHTEGHADYAEEGQDIVCAAASVLVINTVNALELYTDADFSLTEEEETGRIDCRFNKEPSKDADLLLRTMILGLQDMADDETYAAYIDLTFQEVREA